MSKCNKCGEYVHPNYPNLHVCQVFMTEGERAEFNNKKQDKYVEINKKLDRLKGFTPLPLQQDDKDMIRNKVIDAVKQSIRHNRDTQARTIKVIEKVFNDL